MDTTTALNKKNLRTLSTVAAFTLTLQPKGILSCRIIPGSLADLHRAVLLQDHLTAEGGAAETGSAEASGCVVKGCKLCSNGATKW